MMRAVLISDLSIDHISQEIPSFSKQELQRYNGSRGFYIVETKDEDYHGVEILLDDIFYDDWVFVHHEDRGRFAEVIPNRPMTFNNIDYEE